MKNNPELIRWEPIILNGSVTNYIVSDSGLVMNTITKSILKYNGEHYRYVHISHNSKKYNLSVHRLVAIAFIPNPENKPEVNHNDGDKTNNYYWNLEWVTRKENAEHAAINDLIKFGSDKCDAKYTENQVHDVCKLLESGMKRKDVCNRLNVSLAFIDGIIYDGCWHRVSSKYNIPKFIAKEAPVIELLRNGVTDYNQIITILKWPDTTKNRQYLSKIKYKIKNINVQRSSLGPEMVNRSTAQAIGVGENPLNGNA